MSQLNVFLQRTISALLVLAGAFVFFRWLLGPLLPFLLALALSAMAEPLVQRVRRWMGVRRSFAAALVTTLLLAIPGGGAALALVRLGVELRQWSTRLPEVVAGFPAMWNSLLDRAGAWYAASPAFLRSALDMLARCFRTTILKWLRAEALLILTTFVILLTGFLWMGLDYALLAAAFTSLVDALPVLGTGTVLIPWALGCLALGDTGRGLSLLALYAVGLLVHTLLEPRLLAGQADLPPITALLAMYLGFHFMGVGGMVLMPVCLLLLKQFQDAGVVKLWR